AVEDHKGCPHSFMESLKQIPARTFNSNQMRRATDWLYANGYMIDPPTEEEVHRLIDELVSDPAMADHAEALFREAFIPEGYSQRGLFS
ncbi:MAG TPA: hypothetical protein VG944_14005, partial [Fimbriimonas sp.]|nr:hypothetical protein [Fimbriimonas sp.]